MPNRKKTSQVTESRALFMDFWMLCLLLSIQTLLTLLLHSSRYPIQSTWKEGRGGTGPMHTFQLRKALSNLLTYEGTLQLECRRESRMTKVISDVLSMTTYSLKLCETIAPFEIIWSKLFCIGLQNKLLERNCSSTSNTWRCYSSRKMIKQLQQTWLGKMRRPMLQNLG